MMRMSVSEEDLAEAAGQGDAEAFAILVEKAYDRILALAFRLMGVRAEAEDLTQDVCMALPVKLKSYRREARFSTWLYRVTINAAHDRRRRLSRYHKAATGWGQYEENRQAEAAEAKEAERWLTEAMRMLPEDLRDTLALTVTEGIGQAEASDILGISAGTVAWRMSEIKRRLRELAQEDME